MRQFERFKSRDEAKEAFLYERFITNEEKRGLAFKRNKTAEEEYKILSEMVDWLFEKCQSVKKFKTENNFGVKDNRRCCTCKWCRCSIRRTETSEQEYLLCTRNIPFEVGMQNLCNKWEQSDRSLS